MNKKTLVTVFETNINGYDFMIERENYIDVYFATVKQKSKPIKRTEIWTVDRGIEILFKHGVTLLEPKHVEQLNIELNNANTTKFENL